MKLFCAIVGEAESAFELDIDEVASISTLKNTIEEKICIKLKGIPAADLQLFLAKRNKNEQEEEKGGDEEKWLTQDDAQEGVRATSDYTLLRVPGAELRDVGLASGQLGEVSREENAAGTGPVHVLVVLPRQTFTGKRTRGKFWFVDDKISKVHKVDGGHIRYFKMGKFPPMAHSMEKFNKILERDAYRVIFADLMSRTKEAMAIVSPANLVVTGNSDTGKSRFYLYCIFQLLLRHQKQVKELPAFDLVLNFDNDYQLYDTETKEFVRLNEEEVHELQYQQHVLRLVDGQSSHLVGWKGVSILFACPGLDGMKDYAKADTCR